MVSTILKAVITARLLALGAAQWAEPPPTTADPGTIDNCTWWHIAEPSDTCASVADDYGLMEAALTSYNPILSGSCTFVVGNSYCIEQNWGLPPEPPVGSTTTTTSTSSTPTDPGNGVSTPTPTQPDMVDNCDKFYFVEPGTLCDDVVTATGILLADLYEWNPSIGSTCNGLWENVYVCVGVIGGPEPTTPPPTPTHPGNGVATPTPTQPGMVDNCAEFDYVNPDDGCQAVASRNDISLSSFYVWNPDVGSTCAGLWTNVYVCVGVIGGSPPVTSTTAGGSAGPTPTPIQAGMVDGCTTFYLVVRGDTCVDIADAEGIWLIELYSWNPAVGTDCSGLWVGYYVCTSTS